MNNHKRRKFAKIKEAEEALKLDEEKQKEKTSEPVELLPKIIEQETVSVKKKKPAAKEEVKAEE